MQGRNLPDLRGGLFPGLWETFERYGEKQISPRVEMDVGLEGRFILQENGCQRFPSVLQ